MAFKKVTKSDFGYNLDNIKDAEQKSFMENILGTMCDVVNKAMEGAITAEDMKAQFESINERLKGYDAEKFAQVVKDNEELREVLKKAMDTIAKANEAGPAAVNSLGKFEEKMMAMYDSEKFKSFMEGHTRKSGTFDGFSLKDLNTVSMTNDYTGNILITQQQNVIASKYAPKRLHMRDVLTSLAGDPAFPNLAYTEIESMDRNARYATENGRLSESHISVKENQAMVKRLGTYLPISKRMLKSRAYIQSYIVAMLPEAVYSAEDWNILFGDGNGENLEGITKKNGCKSVESIITTAIVTGAAGSVKSVTAYNNAGGVIIEFTNPQPDILDGMKITFANASSGNASVLNKTHDVIKMNDRQILLPDVKLAGAESAVASMTFTVNNGGFKSIEAPNSSDAIKTAFAVMSYAQYYPTAIVLNPITVNMIESEKDTLGRNLGLIENVGGVKYIAGRPIIEYDGIPANKYLLGDFRAVAAALVDYTNLTLEWAEDVETKLTNQVVLIAQEEIIFPVYNPWAFAYGDLSALKTAVTKA